MRVICNPEESVLGGFVTWLRNVIPAKREQPQEPARKHPRMSEKAFDLINRLNICVDKSNSLDASLNQDLKGISRLIMR